MHNSAITTENAQTSTTCDASAATTAVAAQTGGDLVNAMDGGVMTLNDVTGLYRTAELLNQIFDNTHMQIVYLDTNFNFVRVNRAYAEAAGHAPAFFAGKNHFDLYPDPGNEAIFRTVRDTGKSVSVDEKAFEYPDQPERGVTYWDWSLRPVNNEQGIMDGLLLCLLDVTERVHARRKQAESDKIYRDLVENANSIIMRITPDHRILFFNEYAQRFFGYSADEILGRNVIGTIVPAVDSEGRDLRTMTQEITAHPELHGSNDNENICKDGRRVWVHWSNRALRDEQGAVREILCVGTDMTERRKLTRRTDLYRQRLQRLSARLMAIEEQERRRVASQIHDTVVQTLSLSNIRLGGVMTALDKAGLPDQRARIEGVRQMLEHGAQECRGLMEKLVPSLLYEVGFFEWTIQRLPDRQAGRFYPRMTSVVHNTWIALRRRQPGGIKDDRVKNNRQKTGHAHVQSRPRQ